MLSASGGVRVGVMESTAETSPLLSVPLPGLALPQPGAAFTGEVQLCSRGPGPQHAQSFCGDGAYAVWSALGAVRGSNTLSEAGIFGEFSC